MDDVERIEVEAFVAGAKEVGIDIDSTLVDRLRVLLHEWDVDHARQRARQIEHDLDNNCTCSTCSKVASIKAQYG